MDDEDITYSIIRYDLEDEPIAATPEEIHVNCGDIQLPTIRSIKKAESGWHRTALLSGGRHVPGGSKTLSRYYLDSPPRSMGSGAAHGL